MLKKKSLSLFLVLALTRGFEANASEIEIIRRTTLDAKKGLAAVAGFLQARLGRDIPVNLEEGSLGVSVKLPCNNLRHKDAFGEQAIRAWASVRAKDKKLKFEFSSLELVYATSEGRVPGQDLSDKVKLKTITPCFEKYVDMITKKVSAAEAADNW